MSLFGSIILVILTFATVYTISVILIATFKNVALLEATKICRNTLVTIWKATFSSQEPPRMEYPIIGYNGYGMNPHMIESEFHDLKQYFQSFLFLDYKIHPTNNIICYRFTYVNPTTTISEKDLIYIIESTSTSILSSLFYDSGMVFTPQNKVKVKLDSTYVYIYIALNSTGDMRISKADTPVPQHKSDHINEEWK